MSVSMTALTALRSMRLRSLAGIGNAPDAAAGVFGNQQRAVLVHRNPDRAAPDFGIADHEAGGEIVIFAGRRAVFDDDADDFVAGAFGPIPRAMLGGENVAAIVRRELRGVIERHAERGGVRLDEDVGNGDLVLQVRPLAFVPRVLVGADIVPGPAVERAFAYAGDVVGRRVVADAVALVGRAPQRAAAGRNRHADAVTDAVGIDALVLAVGIERQNVGALGFAAPGRAERMARHEVLQLAAGKFAHAVGDIGGRAGRHKHCLAVRREHDVAGMMTAGTEMWDDGFGRAARGGIAVTIGIAENGIGIADIDPLRIGPGRIEGDAERITEPGGEHRRLSRFTTVRPQHADAARFALGDEYVAVRRRAEGARTRQTGGKQVDFKAVWDDWLLVGPTHD